MRHKLAGLWMQLQSQSGADALFVRWGIVLILGMMFWVGAIVPYGEWRDGYLENIRIKSEKLVRLQALESSAEQWKKAYGEYGTSASMLPELLFQGSSSAAAQAELLQLIRQLMNKHQLQLNGQSFVDAKIEPSVGERVAIRLRLRGSLEGLLALLDDVSRQKKIIVMDELVVNHFGDVDYALQLQVSAFWQAEQG